MKRLRVATLNIWNNEGPWTERKQLIRAELARMQPDVMGLQEVLRVLSGESQEQQAGPVRLPRAAERWTNTPDRDQAAALAEGLGYHLRYGAAARYEGGLEFGNALLSRFPVLEDQVFPLPNEQTTESRSLLYALLDTPYGRQPVFVTHLNWKLFHGRVRVRQVLFIVETIFALVPTEADLLPPLLMGDFNAEPESDEIRFLRGFATIEGKSVSFADAWVWGGDGTAGHTFDRKNPFAARSHEPPRRIDYIFVRGPDRHYRGEPTNTRLAFCDLSAINLSPTYMKVSLRWKMVS